MLSTALASLCLYYNIGIVMSETQSISYAYTTRYDWVWNDKGSGSDSDGSFWKPTLNTGESFVTFTNMASHSNPSGTYDALVITSAPSGVLAEPVDYELVWSDAGSGGDYDMYCFRPVPQSGYTCFGHFISRESSVSSWDGFKCVRDDWVYQYTSAEIVRKWDDRGSGADRDGQVLAIHAAGVPNVYFVMTNTYNGVYGGPYYGLVTLQTDNPTPKPTANPTRNPTRSPTKAPTLNPSSDPTQNPSKSPTNAPTNRPSIPPSESPTKPPTTPRPTLFANVQTQPPTYPEGIVTDSAAFNNPYKSTESKESTNEEPRESTSGMGIDLEIPLTIPGSLLVICCICIILCYWYRKEKVWKEIRHDREQPVHLGKALVDNDTENTVKMQIFDQNPYNMNANHLLVADAIRQMTEHSVNSKSSWDAASQTLSVPFSPDKSHGESISLSVDASIRVGNADLELVNEMNKKHETLNGESDVDEFLVTGDEELSNTPGVDLEMADKENEPGSPYI